MVDLGVTRETVYGYFPSTDVLIAAVGLVAMGGFVDDLTDHLASVVDPSEWVVEALACGEVGRRREAGPRAL